MAALGSAIPTGGGSVSGDEDSSQLLADALKKMDGLIGDYRPPSSVIPVLNTDPAVQAILSSCEELNRLITEWQESHDLPLVGAIHPREHVSVSVRDSITAWLGAVDVEQSQVLVQDKEELLAQVATLQQQLEVSQREMTKLSSKVENAERRCLEKDQHLRDTAEELKLAKISLSTKEVELRHLQDQIQARYRSEHGGKKLSFLEPEESAPHRRSFRLKNPFKRKDHHTVALEGANQTKNRPENPRADAFYAKDSGQIADWFKGIGLEMYCDLVEEKQLSGMKLVDVLAQDNNVYLVQFGILSTLHCKKVRLAMKEAMKEAPSPWSGLDHEWVGQWLLSLGLPQFQRTFCDARFDGNMLNMISLEDLELLDITVPFHIASIKRALQALRMCHYDRDYLKEGVDRSFQGSQKLLHWSAKDVIRWVCSIDLEEYVSGLDTAGIHGAVMLLDVHFTSESLARALGISQSKTIIRKHLSKKFMELIGPVAAQNKVDAMQSKSFVPLDPTEAPYAFVRHRSRSVSNKRGQRRERSEQLLLPLDAASSVVDFTSKTARNPTP